MDDNKNSDIKDRGRSYSFEHTKLILETANKIASENAMASLAYCTTILSAVTHSLKSGLREEAFEIVWSSLECVRNGKLDEMVAEMLVDSVLGEKGEENNKRE